jgi:phosphopantothenate synthetase
VKAFGWLPPKADAESLAEYAARQSADVVLVSTEDKDLVEALRRSATGDARDRARSRTGRSIEVEAVPPA